MPMAEDKKEKTNRLIIPGALTIYEAAGCREMLLAGLEAEGDIELDLSQTAGCDTAGLQLLLAFRRSARRLGKSVRVTGASNAVSETLSAAGLDSEEIVGT